MEDKSLTLMTELSNYRLIRGCCWTGDINAVEVLSSPLVAVLPKVQQHCVAGPKFRTCGYFIRMIGNIYVIGLQYMGQANMMNHFSEDI